MGYYYENRKRAQIKNTDPSLTEQSMARDTDINVIVGKFKITGRVPGGNGQPMTGDWTQLPQDLRGFIDTARDFNNKRRMLPKELQNIKTDELLNLTIEDIAKKLAPPAPTPEPKKEEPK